MKPHSISPGYFFKKMICFSMVLFLLLPMTASAADNPVLIGGKESGIINLILVGQDRRDESRARSDTMILATFHPDSKTVAITSFLRDLYLPIPGHESNRLNAAYAYGGMELMEQTLQENFGIVSDGCVEVDFSNFSQIIDLLGGVSLELRQDEAEAINASVPGNLSAGVHLLNGSQALAYSRIRNLDEDGDFSRTLRQRKLLSSLLERYRNADLLTILSTVVDLLPMLSTDLSKREILVLAAKLFPMLDDPTIITHRVPTDGSYACQRINGMDVLVADLEENREKLIDILSFDGDSNP